MTTEELLAHLTTLCEKKRPASTWSAPFRATLDRTLYVGATNAQAMVLALPDDLEAASKLPDATEAVGLVFPATGQPRPLRLAALEQWVKDGRQPPMPCSCERGFRPVGGSCFETDSQEVVTGHFERCFSCDGTPGTKHDRAARPGVIAGVPVNRTLLDDFILPDDWARTVSVGAAPTAPVVVRGARSIVLVMPVQVPPEGLPVFDGWSVP